MSKTRTPHLDRVLAKLHAAQLRRGSRPVPRLSAAQRQAASRVRQLAAQPAEPDRHRTTEPHKHTCITPSCQRRYICDNVCDPVDEGLKNSICPECFQDIIQETPRL